MNDDVQDRADQAEAAEQRFRDAALAYRKPALVPCGRCYWCDEPVHPGEFFCRPDAGGSCRDDFEVMQAAKRRNGAS